jgi:hypothetical protein
MTALGDLFPAFLYEVTSEWPDPRQATILPSHPHLHIIILHRRQFSASSQHSGIYIHSTFS